MSWILEPKMHLDSLSWLRLESTVNQSMINELAEFKPNDAEME